MTRIRGCRSTPNPSWTLPRGKSARPESKINRKCWLNLQTMLTETTTARVCCDLTRKENRFSTSSTPQAATTSRERPSSSRNTRKNLHSGERRSSNWIESNFRRRERKRSTDPLLPKATMTSRKSSPSWAKTGTRLKTITRAETARQVRERAVLITLEVWTTTTLSTKSPRQLAWSRIKADQSLRWRGSNRARQATIMVKDWIKMIRTRSVRASSLRSHRWIQQKCHQSRRPQEINQKVLRKSQSLKASIWMPFRVEIWRRIQWSNRNFQKETLKNSNKTSHRFPAETPSISSKSLKWSTKSSRTNNRCYQWTKMTKILFRMMMIKSLRRRDSIANRLVLLSLLNSLPSLRTITSNQNRSRRRTRSPLKMTARHRPSHAKTSPSRRRNRRMSRRTARKSKSILSKSIFSSHLQHKSTSLTRASRP